MDPGRNPGGPTDQCLERTAKPPIGAFALETFEVLHRPVGPGRPRYECVVGPAGTVSATSTFLRSNASNPSFGPQHENETHVKTGYG